MLNLLTVLYVILLFQQAALLQWVVGGRALVSRNEKIGLISLKCVCSMANHVVSMCYDTSVKGEVAQDIPDTGTIFPGGGLHLQYTFAPESIQYFAMKGSSIYLYHTLNPTELNLSQWYANVPQPPYPLWCHPCVKVQTRSGAIFIDSCRYGCSFTENNPIIGPFKFCQKGPDWYDNAVNRLPVFEGTIFSKDCLVSSSNLMNYLRICFS